MPYRRGKKNYRKKPVRKGRSFRKRPSRKYKTSRSIPKGGARMPFPLVKNVAFTYSDDPIYMAQTFTEVPSSQEWRGNSVYDCDLTGAGTQPRYVDTFLGASSTAAPYSQYRVIASKIELNIIPDPTLTSANNLGIFFCFPVLSGTADVQLPSSQKEIMERPMCRWRILGNTGDKAQARISAYCTTRAITGRQDPKDPSLSALYSGNPSTVWKWCCGILNISNSGVFKCYVYPRITYYCQLFNLNDVADS